MINPFDVFNALTLIGKIAVLMISGVVFLVIYSMFKTLKKPETEYLLRTDTSFVKKGTSGYEEEKTIVEDAVSETEPTVESEAIVDEDKEFEEEKRKLESFGKKKPKRSPDAELLQKIREDRSKKVEKKIEGQFIQRKPKTKPKEKIMKLSGTCDFCGKNIGGPVKSKKARLLSYDPERLETAKYVTKEFLDLPFVCSWCGGTFCQDHRLPEQHDCKKLYGKSNV